MKGRWFAKHEAYRSIRYKKDGDFVEPKYDYREIVANDLSDIEKHNNTLHPLERTFGRKTRRQIMMDNFNPACPKLERSYMWRYVGNEAADINIYNHDYVKCANAEFELADYESLRRLRPGNRKVSAYWLPEDDGRVDRVYLYQGDTYIGEAVDRRQTDFNENQIEQTAEDAEKKLHQFKRLSKFDRMIREERTEIPRVEVWEDPASSQPPLHRREEEEKACKDLFLKDPADKTADYTDDFDMDDYEQKAIMVM